MITRRRGYYRACLKIRFDNKRQFFSKLGDLFKDASGSANLEMSSLNGILWW